MALYKYLAAGRGEKTAEVLLEADNRAAACEKLRMRGLVPVRFLGESSASGVVASRRKGVDTTVFTRELRPLLTASIPLERALAILAEGAHGSQKEFVNSLRQGLHEGKKFSELLRSCGDLFPPYYANLTESAEESGCLPEVFGELEKFMKESKELKDFIISSSIYPAAVLAVTAMVTVLLFTVFVPRFAKIFLDMGRALPPSIDFLMTLSNLFKIAWWLVPLGMVGTYLMLLKTWGKEELHRRISAFYVKLPIVGSLAVDLEMCRYLRTLAILIGNHVEIIRSLGIARKVIGNPVIAEGFLGIERQIGGGDKLSAAFKNNLFLPPNVTPMLRVGEESGTVGEMLGNIAEYLENDTRTKIKRLLNLFTPLVIVFLAIVVLIVVVSIFVAMMEINSITQKGPSL
ncbi:MAG: type II secretion system F family protein [Victivallaceae bacterium]|nr:type II secretion system F family protein [Victivallaceae bacterium]